MLTNQQRIDMYEREIARLYEWKDDMQKDVTYYENKTIGLEMEIKDLQTQSNCLENENQNLKIKIGHLQESHRKKTREIYSLGKTNNAIGATLVNQKRMIDELLNVSVENTAIVEIARKMYDELSKAIEESR